MSFAAIREQASRMSTSSSSIQLEGVSPGSRTVAGRGNDRLVVSTDMDPRDRRRENSTPSPSLSDMVKLVTKDLLSQYACNGSYQQPLRSNFAFAASVAAAQRESSHHEDMEDGIEFNEEEILRRDYELARV